MNKVKITNKGNALVIDIYVYVPFGMKIPDLAWNIQNNVVLALKEEGIETKISSVNIHIQGVIERIED